MGNIGVKSSDDLEINVPDEQLDAEKIDQFKDVNTLIFQGGSVKGLAYVGAMSALEKYIKKISPEKTFLGQIQNIAGTSAGSITALLISLGLSIEKIGAIMKTTVFSTFADSPFWASLYIGKFVEIFSRGYLCEGKTFIDWLKGIIKDAVGNEEITFKELQEKTGKNMMVFAVRLNDNQLVEFSPQKTPKVKVWLAVRMSMSIPIFFKPVRVNHKGEGVDTEIELDEETGKTYYVDGGLIANYPWVQVLESLKVDLKKVLGFKIMSKEELDTLGKKVEQKKWPEIDVGFSKHLISYSFNPLFAVQDNTFFSESESGHAMRSRTVRVFDENVSFLNFKMSKKVKEALISSGIKSILNFFNRDKDAFNDTKMLLKMEKDYSLEDVTFKANYFQKEIDRIKLIISNITKNGNVERNPIESMVDLMKDLRKLKSYISLTLDYVRKHEEIVQRYISMQTEVMELIESFTILLKSVGFKEEKERFNVQVTILEAKDLPNTDANRIGGSDLSDPYCMVTLDGVTKYTKTLDNTLNPEWNEELKFEKVKDSAILEIKVYDKDLLSSDLLGKIQYRLKNLEFDKPQWIKLSNSNEVSQICILLIKSEIITNNVSSTKQSFL